MGKNPQHKTCIYRANKDRCYCWCERILGFQFARGCTEEFHFVIVLLNLVFLRLLLSGTGQQVQGSRINKRFRTSCSCDVVRFLWKRWIFFLIASRKLQKLLHLISPFVNNGDIPNIKLNKAKPGDNKERQMKL